MKTPHKNIKILKFGIIFLLILLPFNFALNLNPAFDMAIIRVLIPILFLIWIWGNLYKKNFFIDNRFRFWLLNFILILSLCSIFWAPNTEKAFRKIIFLFSIFPVYWFFYPFLRKKASLKLFLKIFFITAFISALIGFFQFIAQFIFGLNSVLKLQSQLAPFFLGKNFAEVVLAYNSWLVNVNGKTLLRAIGLFPDPHLFSLFLNISLPVGVFLFLKNKNIYWLGALGVILSTSLLTFSRAGYLSLLVILILIWFKFLKQKNIWHILLILLFFTFLFVPNPINQRLFSSLNFQDNSVSERLTLLKTGLEITKENFWGGVGIGNLSEIIQPQSDVRIPVYAHNLFLDFSTEIGFFGGLAVFLLIIIPIKNYFQKTSPEKLMVASIFIIILVHSMFETPFYSVHLLPLILMFLAI